MTRCNFHFVFIFYFFIFYFFIFFLGVNFPSIDSIWSLVDEIIVLVEDINFIAYGDLIVVPGCKICNEEITTITLKHINSISALYKE